MKTVLGLALVLLVGALPVRAQETSGTPPAAARAPAVERTVTVTDVSGKHAVKLVLTATPRVSAEAMERLATGIVVRRLRPAERRRTDLSFWREKAVRPDAAQPDIAVRLQPVEPGLTASDFVWLWPDGFAVVGPGVVRVEKAYGRPSRVEPVDVPVQKLIGPNDRLTGRLVCRSSDTGSSGGTTTNDLAYLRIRIGQYWAVTDATGRFDITGDFPEPGSLGNLRLEYDATVTRGPSTGSRLLVMNEGHTSRADLVRAPQGTTSGTTLDLGTVTVQTGDCELWTLGTALLDHFHRATGNSPPAGELRIKRWGGVYDGTPYTFYDYIVLSADYVQDHDSRWQRRSTLAHEFGHSIRHAADGDMAHWNWDNFRWAYGRIHDGTEISNVQYAFNEGWASYWESTVTGSLPSLGGAPEAAAMDWNERRVAHRLSSLGNAANAAEMVRVLTANPGAIHDLHTFEKRYCERVTLPNAHCTGDRRPTRAAPPSCPPNYIDDGATCRLDNIRAKPSYGRGVGIPPTDCGAGREYDAGLCYPNCRSGYDGVGPLCWQRCPSGYHDDGVTCRRDAVIQNSDNSDCPGYDKCGLTFAKGCSHCPEGFHNDGCTCRRNAHIFGKDSYGRGVGRVPESCRSGLELDSGLCYSRCRSGYDGVGPVCWGTCPSGYDDHGATCYRAPHVIVKY